MSTLDISLISAGCVLGYCVVGAIMSVILAAVTVRDYNSKSDGFIVVFGSCLWPFTFLGLVIVGVSKLGAPLGRLVARRWEASVRRLNPEYKGIE